MDCCSERGLTTTIKCQLYWNQLTCRYWCCSNSCVTTNCSCDIPAGVWSCYNCSESFFLPKTKQLSPRISLCAQNLFERPLVLTGMLLLHLWQSYHFKWILFHINTQHISYPMPAFYILKWTHSINQCNVGLFCNACSLSVSSQHFAHYEHFSALAKRQGSPRRSKRRSLSISCCILSRWPEATGQALPVLLHLECTVQRWFW